MRFTAVLAFIAGAFILDFDKLPPYASLIAAVVIAAFVLCFGGNDTSNRRDW